MKIEPFNRSKFIISVSDIDPKEVAIINRNTDDFASRKLKSMKPIIKRFKVFLNSDETMTFSHFPKSRLDELKAMLPKHRL